MKYWTVKITIRFKNFEPITDNKIEKELEDYLDHGVCCYITIFVIRKAK